MIRSVIVLCSLVAVASASPLGWRVVGGQDAKEGQFPYQASLRIGGRHHCGCSIINNRWLVTAAHCLEGINIYPVTIAVGSLISDDPNAKVYQPQNIFSHEKWNSLTLANDIGLIQVTEPIEMSDSVQVIPLNTQEIPEQSEVILSGWGETWRRSADILQWITLKTLNSQTCQDMHWDVPIKETHLCTLTKVGEGACYGDSGGPLVWEGKLCGIVSFGIPCGKGIPDVFTRISEYIPWIKLRIDDYSD